MRFPKTFGELKQLIIDLWAATLKRLREDVDKTEIRVEIVEEEVDTLETEVEENTEEILATKAELQEVKDLLVLLIQDLASKGLLDDPRLLELLNEEILILK